jgi:F0F1-type ATP synthase delta subunit
MGKIRMSLNSLIPVLAKLDGISDINQLQQDLFDARKLACKRTKEFRLYRHDIMIGNTQDQNNFLLEYYDRYGLRSYTFGTIAKLTSIRRLTKSEMDKEKKALKLPPAFNEDLQSELLDIEAMKELIDKHCKSQPLSGAINMAKRVLREQRNRDISKDKPILLINNSSTEFQDGDIDLTDFMTGLYLFEELSGYSNICKLTGVVNNRHSQGELADPFAYISNIMHDRNYCGEVLYIPDKDGKMRLIFRLHPQYQVISKGIHLLLDKIAKQMYGNYTYNHRGWVFQTLEKHMDKYIIATDIEKFSDTLDRRIMLYIISKFGFTEEELDEIDKLYSLPIKDTKDGTIYTGYNSTLQGQYGDFPWITIVNLFLQYIVYLELDEKYDKSYNAAVGDDTAFIFENYRPEAIDTIVEIYGKCGMNINLGKTTTYFRGSGIVEFVKLKFDSNGVLPYLDPSAFHNNDIDAIVRQIFDHPILSPDDKKMVLKTLFGESGSNNLMDLNLINGGIQDSLITRDDVVILSHRIIKLRELNTIKDKDIIKWVTNVTRDLYNAGGRWKDTIYSCLNDEPELEDDDEVEERIKLGVVRSQRLGFDPEHNIDLDRLIGKDPRRVLESDIKSNIFRDKPKTDEEIRITNFLKDFERLIANEKNVRVRRNKRFISTYLSIIDGDYDPGSIVYLNKITKYSRRIDSISSMQNDTYEYIRDSNLIKMIDSLVTQGIIRVLYMGTTGPKYQLKCNNEWKRLYKVGYELGTSRYKGKYKLAEWNDWVVYTMKVDSRFDHPHSMIEHYTKIKEYDTADR